MPSDEPPTDRAALVNRQLPEMTLSDASPSSNTYPSNPPSSAEERFRVRGTAVLTGGAGTLALFAARALLEHGCDQIFLWDLSTQWGRPDFIDSCAQLQADFGSPEIPKRLQLISVDVTDPNDVTAAVEHTLSKCTNGRIDILCTFAGVVGCQHFLDLKPEEYKRVMDVNATGTFLCSQAVARVMAAQSPPGGSIVHTSSISAHRINYPQPQVPYNVSKAAVLHMTRSMAAELAVHGIRVNSISPGYMDTILNEGEGLAKARAIWTGRNPMGRMGMPWELQGVVVLLCSQAGAYVNGADFVVDGGGSVF